MTLEKEALEETVASMENHLASLQKERVINTSLKEALAEQNDEIKKLLHYLKQKKHMVMNVSKSLKVPYVAQLRKMDSTLKKDSFMQPPTSTSPSCFIVEK